MKRTGNAGLDHQQPGATGAERITSMGGPNSGRRPNRQQRQRVVRLRHQGLAFWQIGQQLGITRPREADKPRSCSGQG